MTKSINPKQLHDLLEKAPETTLIDVRDDYEYTRGHVPGTTQIPMYEIFGHFEKMDREKPAYFICQFGISRSVGAAQLADRLGFKQAFFIEGGTSDWEENGFPLEKGEGRRPQPATIPPLVPALDPQRHVGLTDFNGTRAPVSTPKDETPSRDTDLSKK